MYDARKRLVGSGLRPDKEQFLRHRTTYDIFHRWGEAEMLRAKWGLDGGHSDVLSSCWMRLFLRAAGVGSVGSCLFYGYAASGLVVCVFWALDGRGGAADPGYNVAREVLGFLQSPMPSLMLVLLPWLRDRALRNAEGGQGG